MMGELEKSEIEALECAEGSFRAWYLTAEDFPVVLCLRIMTNNNGIGAYSYYSAYVKLPNMRTDKYPDENLSR